MSEPALALTGCATITVPALIAGAGDRAALRFLEFFTVNIRNANTRAAYARAAGNFLLWCETRAGRGLKDIQPVRVATYIEELQGKRSAPTIMQDLACIRMPFDWLVIGQVMASNPAHGVRGPRHSVMKGVTPVLSFPLWSIGHPAQGRERVFANLLHLRGRLGCTILARGDSDAGNN